MSKSRQRIPAAVERSIRVEAGHRCAVTTCRATSGLEIHHIKSWASSKDNSADNLILLCAVCHARVTKGEIDRKSVREYKRNLSLLNGRYGDLERRVLEFFASNPEADTIHIDLAHEILLRYLVEDGLLVHVEPADGAFMLGSDDESAFVYGPAVWQLTPAGDLLVDSLRRARRID